MNWEHTLEDNQEQQQLPDSPVEVADMIELTPEGIRDNFSRLLNMNNHQQGERLRDVRTRLDYGEGPSSTPAPGEMRIDPTFTLPTGDRTSAFTGMMIPMPGFTLVASTQAPVSLIESLTLQPVIPLTLPPGPQQMSYQMAPPSFNHSSEPITSILPFSNPRQMPWP
jgi:hypothetical protein